MVAYAALSGPGGFGVGTESVDVDLTGFDLRFAPPRPRLLPNPGQLGSLLLREQPPDLEQRIEAVLVESDLGLTDGLGLLHHRRFVGSLLGQEIAHLPVQIPKLPTELPGLLSGVIDDRLDRLHGLIIQTELRSVLFEEPIRSTAWGRTTEGAGSTAARGPTEGLLREALTGNGQSREQSGEGYDEVLPTHGCCFLIALEAGFSAASTFRLSKRAPGLRPYPSMNTLAIAR